MGICGMRFLWIACLHCVELMLSTLNFSHFDLNIIEKYKSLILGITLNVFGIKCLTLEVVGQLEAVNLCMLQ